MSKVGNSPDSRSLFNSVLNQLTNKSTGVGTCSVQSLLENQSGIAKLCAAEILRKQHRYHEALQIYIPTCLLFTVQTPDGVRKEDLNGIMLNKAICNFYIGDLQQCINDCILINQMACSSNTNTAKALTSCAFNLMAVCYANIGDLNIAEECLVTALTVMLESLGQQHQHTKIAIVKSNLALIKASNGKIEEAKKLLSDSMKTFKDTMGEKSVAYSLAKVNDILIDAASIKNHGKCQEELKKVQLTINSLDDSVMKKMNVIQETMNKLQKRLTWCNEQPDNAICSCSFDVSLLWKSGFMQILDYPFAWIDYALCDKTIFIGADSQVEKSSSALVKEVQRISLRRACKALSR